MRFKQELIALIDQHFERQELEALIRGNAHGVQSTVKKGNRQTILKTLKPHMTKEDALDYQLTTHISTCLQDFVEKRGRDKV